jgi:pilus assembly protein CpaE
MPPGEDVSALLSPEDLGRTDRPVCVAFVTDGVTEAALQAGLADVLPTGVEIRRGGVRAAVLALQRMPTPRMLIVDVGGEDSPLAALEELAHVVEPHVCVLVVGDPTSLDFYREVTRRVGAMEYLAKPLSREIVARHFGPLALGRAPTGNAALGGRLVTITGARGGVGASTIAVNLAWHFGVSSRRHTVLLDPDLHQGTASFLLNIEPGRGLRTALQTPDRIDALLAERAAYPVTERLHVLSGQEPFDVVTDHAPGAAEKLMDALRRRYNFIVGDVPFRSSALHRDLLNLSHHRVLVLEPTLASIRDALRLMALRPSPAQSSRPALVLNRLGLPGGLSKRQVEEALKTKVDVIIPDLPKQVGAAATLGKPVAEARGAFRDAILALSRQVAFSRLVDSADQDEADAPSVARGLGRLLRKSK